MPGSTISDDSSQMRLRRFETLSARPPARRPPAVTITNTPAGCGPSTPSRARRRRTSGSPVPTARYGSTAGSRASRASQSMSSGAARASLTADLLAVNEGGPVGALGSPPDDGRLTPRPRGSRTSKRAGGRDVPALAGPARGPGVGARGVRQRAGHGHAGAGSALDLKRARARKQALAQGGEAEVAVGQGLRALGRGAPAAVIDHAQQQALVIQL